MTWNLFNGYTDRSRERQFAEQVNIAKDIRDKTCRDLRQTLLIAFNDVKKLKEQLGYLERTSPRSAKRSPPTASSSTSGSARCWTCSIPRTSCSRPGVRSPSRSRTRTSPTHASTHPSAASCARSNSPASTPAMLTYWLPGGWKAMARNNARLNP